MSKKLLGLVDGLLQLTETNDSSLCNLEVTQGYTRLPVQLSLDVPHFLQGLLLSMPL